jgi:putative membrane protein
MSAIDSQRRGIAFVLVSISLVPAAVAHGADTADGWTFDPWIVIPLIVTLAIYLYGARRLWRRGTRGRRQRIWSALTYGGGWLTLALALLSPFHGLGEHLFTYHMAEHEIIMAVAAPLLILARPLGVMMWSLPRSLRSGLSHAAQSEAVQRSWAWLVRPINATVIHGAAIWLWHWPALFDAAVTHLSLHRWQHTTFLVTALLFWYSLLRISRSGEAVWHLFFTMLHTSVLGALIAVAPRVLYTTQTAHSLAWGLTALEDQQLAGIFMWVPAGTIYVAAALVFAARWINSSPQETHSALGKPHADRTHGQ